MFPPSPRREGDISVLHTPSKRRESAGYFFFFAISFSFYSLFFFFPLVPPLFSFSLSSFLHFFFFFLFFPLPFSRFLNTFIFFLFFFSPFFFFFFFSLFFWLTPPPPPKQKNANPASRPSYEKSMLLQTPREVEATNFIRQKGTCDKVDPEEDTKTLSRFVELEWTLVKIQRFGIIRSAILRSDFIFEERGKKCRVFFFFSPSLRFLG